uniref:Uncharacterized protein n=1 Tax=viral metagenome TaxID=1070528 RepID=A0A6C0C610_9ZZZZ
MSACNGTQLMMDRDAMVCRLYQNIAITKKDICDSLHFINNVNKLHNYYDDDFHNTIQKMKIEIPNEQYALFADLCSQIYENYANDYSSRLALCIFFEQVTNHYYPYHTLQKERENYKVPEIDVQKYLEKVRKKDNRTK